MYSESERSVSNVALSGTMRTERFAAFSLRAICEYILCVFPVPARPMMKLTFAGIFPSCVQNFENYPHFIAKLWIISPKNELTVKINSGLRITSERIFCGNTRASRVFFGHCSVFFYQYE